MTNLNILIVEGNDPKNNDFFIKAAKASCSENLKNLVLKLEPSSVIKIINPSNDDQTKKALENIKNYHGIIFTGGAMRLNDMTDEIKKHIKFASNCFKYENKILARIYQSIRIEVNSEIDCLKKLLNQIPQVLKKNGIASIITYHSIEDRLVKRFFKNGCFNEEPMKDDFGNQIKIFRTEKFKTANDFELKNNSRSRSAKLRVAKLI